MSRELNHVCLQKLVKMADDPQNESRVENGEIDKIKEKQEYFKHEQVFDNFQKNMIDLYESQFAIIKPSVNYEP